METIPNTGASARGIEHAQPAVSNVAFIAEMFRHLPENAWPVTCSFAGDPTTAPKSAWTARVWNVRAPTSFALRPASNNYICVSSFQPDHEGRVRRRKALFRRLHAVMVDDIGVKLSRERLRLPLSAEVETSPGNSQGWYFLKPSPFSDDLHAATRLLDQLVAVGLTSDGKDPGMKGVTRYARPPVGVNGKQKYVDLLGAPFACRIQLWQPYRRYTCEEIAEAYGLDMSPPPPRRPPRRRPRGNSRDAAAYRLLFATLAQAGLYIESNRRTGVHSVVCPWVHEHTDRAETGTALFDPSPENDWHGGFKCHHGHCEGRRIGDVYRFARELRERRP